MLSTWADCQRNPAQAEEGQEGGMQGQAPRSLGTNLQPSFYGTRESKGGLSGVGRG